MAVTFRIAPHDVRPDENVVQIVNPSGKVVATIIAVDEVWAEILIWVEGRDVAEIAWGDFSMSVAFRSEEGGRS